MAYNAYGRSAGWDDKWKRTSTKPLAPEVSMACLHEVLDQLNEEKARQQDEMVKLHIDLRTQQGVVAQIAEALLGGSIEEAIDRNRRELEKQTEHVDLQSQVIGDIITKMEEHKVRATSQAGELKKLNQILDEMREDFSIETKGCISAASQKVVTECRGLVAEEMAKMRAEMAQEESRRGQEAAALRSELALATEAASQKAEEMAKMRAEMAQEESRRSQETAALRSELALATEAAQAASQRAEEMVKMRAEMAQEESRRSQEAAALRLELALTKEAMEEAQNQLTAAAKACEGHAGRALEAQAAGAAQAAAAEQAKEAAQNALAAAQSNADVVREKTTEVQGLAQQMAEQASALRETSSAVALAGDRAAGALATEAERHIAILEEKLRRPEVSASSPTSAESESPSSKLCMELQSQVEDLRSKLNLLPSQESVEARLGEVRRDLADCAQITQVLSQKVEVVEHQFLTELAGHKEELMSKFKHHEEKTSPKAGEEEGVSRARLEEMISTALERTLHLEQSLVEVSQPKVPLELTEQQVVLEAEIRELKNRSHSLETRLLEELAQVAEAVQGKPMVPRSHTVRSVPPALRGMIHSALPLPSDVKNRKALVIGCSYMETSNALLGAFNDAWNVLSLLRHTLQFSESQVRFLVDGSRSCPMPQPRRPTAAVITESLQWLVQDAQPGDSIFLYFAGYGALLPHGVGTFESCLVPVDYGFLAPPQMDTGSGYRLIPMSELSAALAKLPAGCKATVVLDCCHSALPWLGAKSQPAIFQWAQMQPAAFSGEELPVHVKARRLVLPSVPLARPAPVAASFQCQLTCYGAGEPSQWCAELPIEGVVQGAFTWAWVKAMLYSTSVTQMRSHIDTHLLELRKQYRWLDQKPLVQMSKLVEQQELGRDAIPVPDIICKPLPSNPRRKALIVGINYAGSHARLKGAVNDAWNMHTMLRQSLLMEEDQVRILTDESKQPAQVPTKANILSNFQWLMEGAQPGDSLILVFCGFGTQHPKEPDSKDFEAFLVPSDYASDVPKDWWAQVVAPVPVGITKTVPKPPPGAAYRLISMLELNRFMTQVPAGATLTTLLDCSYPALPGVSADCNIPPTFPRVNRGRVDYEKMFDFVTRPRFLKLPPLPVQHTPPQIWRPQTFPKCRLHCFCAGRLQEWPSEMPLEGTVQGTFTWAFAKAVAAGEFRGTVAQQHQALEGITAQLKQHFQGVEQSPVLMLSQSASSSDTVFA